MRSYFLTLITLLSMSVALANIAYAGKINMPVAGKPDSLTFNTDGVCPDSLIKFAQTLIGTRYRSATSDPLRGFDCSGFVSYVFKSFNFKVPRSSGDFFSIGEKVNLEDAKPGDIIIFTSPKRHSHRIGHVGIVFSNDSDGVKFIHSTSGKEHGVTITAMDDTYRGRFVRVVRLLKMNDVSLAAVH
jgi:lipoprotein Spr